MKKSLMERGMKLMADPRVMKLMQDERVMKAMMTAFQVRGKVQSSIDQQAEKFAKTFKLATKDDLREMKRALAKMENHLKKLEKERDQLKKDLAASKSE